MGLIGKIGLIFVSIVSLYAAELKVSNSQIIPGEGVDFQIVVNGEDIIFPQISNIDNFDVIKTGTATNTTVINGKVSAQKRQGYRFFPDKNTTIPSFKVITNGKEEYTKPTTISIISNNQLSSKEPFSVTLITDKKRYFVGQMIKLHVQMKIDERLNIGDFKMAIAQTDNFWINDKPIQTQINENGYKIIDITYWLSPLKDGNLTLGPVKATLGIKTVNSDPFNSFFERLNYKTFNSNSIALEVNPLANSAKVVGDFTINAIVDKDEVEATKPVNITLSIKGDGNLDELQSLKKEIKNVIIYEDKPTIKSSTSTENYKSLWQQKLAYISSEDFTIPPFSLTFFDTKTNKIKTIKTEPILVHVKKEASKNSQDQSQIIKPETKKVIVEKIGIHWIWSLVIFALGLCIGFIFSKIKFKNIFSKKIKIFKNEKELLQEILPLKDKNSELNLWIEKLEENIYIGKKHKIDRKKIANILTQIMH